jgi:hypothetical protein
VEVKEFKPQVLKDVDKVNVKEQLRDHHLYQLLHLVVKLSSLCPTMMTHQDYKKDIQILAGNLVTFKSFNF